jgi:hypothetical protein
VYHLCMHHTGPYATAFLVLLVCPMFQMNRVHFRLLPTDARVHPIRQAMVGSTLHRNVLTILTICLLIPVQGLRSQVLKLHGNYTFILVCVC